MVSKNIQDILIKDDAPILVVGAGVTGKALGKKFQDAGRRVLLVDEKGVEGCELETRQNISAAAFQKMLSEEHFSFAVKSPGFSPSHPFVTALKAQKIETLTEPEIAFSLLGMPLVAVTGTNGKTTTVHLIHEMLKRSGREVHLVGNVGSPMIELVDDAKFRTFFQTGTYEQPSFKLVAELSSYQLDAMSYCKPHIGAILNIDDDHLEWHGTFENYLAAKAKMFSHQDCSDFSLLNVNDCSFKALCEQVPGTLIQFGVCEATREENFSFYHKGEKAIVLRTGGKVICFDCSKTKLFGLHNKENLSAAVACAYLAGVDEQTIGNVINNFQPLLHRVTLAGTRRGVSFVNDSKGTNVSAVVAAVNSIVSEGDFGDERRIILLLGGAAKEGSWEPISRLASSELKQVVFFGRDGESIRAQIFKDKATQYNYFYGLEEAVHTAFREAAPGDIVLLSPGCASFDAYQNYKERGEHFMSIVRSLPNT